MSATLEAEQFSDYFDGAKILYVQGRQYPVEVASIEPQRLLFPDDVRMDVVLAGVLQSNPVDRLCGFCFCDCATDPSNRGTGTSR